MLHIFTLNWNGKEKMQKLSKSLDAELAALWLGKSIKAQWHIKDNASNDGSIEEMESWKNTEYLSTNLIKYANNRQSYSEGMNFLYKQASDKISPDDFILTLNNDVIFKEKANPGSLFNMIDILEKDSSIGIVGAKLNYTGTDNIQHCGVLFHPDYRLPFHYRGNEKEQDRDKQNRYYPVVTGAVSLMRANTFAKACTTNKSGNVGFCEDYFWAFEDVDMCMRVQYLLKKNNVYCGKTEIFHEESASLKKNPVHKMFFDQNRKSFLSHWKQYIDTSLVAKYDEPGYNLYRK